MAEIRGVLLVGVSFATLLAGACTRLPSLTPSAAGHSEPAPQNATKRTKSAALPKVAQIVKGCWQHPRAGSDYFLDLRTPQDLGTVLAGTLSEITESDDRVNLRQLTLRPLAAGWRLQWIGEDGQTLSWVGDTTTEDTAEFRGETPEKAGILTFTKISTKELSVSGLIPEHPQTEFHFAKVSC